ncbi:hypothetical protein GCM10027425_20370 [Alteromonas gracilis]
MNNTWLAAFGPVLVGFLLAFVAMFGLVMSQTAAPDKNPATQSALVYGE